MADRVQVPELDTFRAESGRASGRFAAARPVDSYFRPTTDPVAPAKPSEFDELAKTLNVIAPTLQQGLLETDKRLSDEQIKAGVEARLKNQKSFKQAVNEGLIPEASNPWFVKGYMQQDGRLSAMEYDTAMRTAWASSPVKESDNPQDLTKFIGDFRKSWMQDKQGGTQDWMDGFIPGIHQSESNLTAQHIAHRQAEISKTVRENTANEIGMLLSRQQEREAGMSPTDPMVMEDRRLTAIQIQNLTKGLVQKGLPGSDANRIIAEVVIAKGVELQDGDYARYILKNIETPGGNVAGIADVTAKLNSAETLIRNQKWHERRETEHDEDRPYAVASRNFGLQQIEHTKEQWAKEKVSYDRTERVRARVNEMTMQVLAGKALDPRDLQALAKDDASHASWVYNFQHSYHQLKADIVTDQYAFATTMLKMSNDPSSVTAKDIFGGVQSGRWDKGTAMTMWNERQQMTGPGQDPANRDPNFTSLNHGLVSGIAGNLQNISGSAQFDASAASVEFRKFYAETMGNDKLAPSEKQAALRKKQRELLEFYNPLASQQSTDVKAATKTGEFTPTAPKATIRGEKSDGPLPIPPAAIQFLMQHPESAADFEKKYNLAPGSSDAITGRAGRRLDVPASDNKPRLDVPNR